MTDPFKHKIAIKYNDTHLKEFCAVCGEVTEPEIPLDLFLNESLRPVCAKCGVRHAPELVRLLAYYYENL